MQWRNNDMTFGALSKFFHWNTASLIGILLISGFWAVRAPQQSDIEIAQKIELFSWHKTIGILLLFFVIMRLASLAFQKRPRPLANNHPIEIFLAKTIHIILAICLILIPLSGWLLHASTEGFAPHLLPFSQNLPFIEKSQTNAKFVKSLHHSSVILLVAALALHIAGALKHNFVDHDATLRRMLPFSSNSPIVLKKNQPNRYTLACWGAASLPVLAVLLWASSSFLEKQEIATPEPLVTRGWEILDGSISIKIKQMGAGIQGGFEQWQAQIDFDPDREGAILGKIDAQIAVTSLTLGNVTEQALSADFLDAAQHDLASYSAQIIRKDKELFSDGALMLKGIQAPVGFPFTLEIKDGIATAVGRFTLDRRDLNIGSSISDSSTLDFPVDVSIALRAQLVNPHDAPF